MFFRKGLLVFVGIIMLLATGCRQGAVSIERERGSDTFVITLNLLESEVETLVADVLAETALPLSNPIVDLQTGQIVVTGEYERPDGSIVNGRITIVPSVENGALLLQATSVEIEGVDVSDERIEQLNERLAERMGSRADREGRALTLQSVTVSADDMELVYTAERQQ